MTERENILARVREALTVLAPRPGHAHDATPSSPASSFATLSRQSAAAADRHPSPSQWLPLVGESYEERLALFRKNAADLKTDFQLVKNRDELSQKLLELRDCEGW